MQAFTFTVATLVAVAAAEPDYYSTYEEPSLEEKIEWAIRDLEHAAEDIGEVAQDPEAAFMGFLEDLECDWARIEPRTDCKRD